MIIDFDSIEQTVMPALYGGEKEFRAHRYIDELNKIMRITLIPGASVGLHTHEDSSEIIYVLSGEGKMLYDDGTERLSANMCHYCPKGHSHSFINDGKEDLVFFAVVPKQ